MKKVLIAIFLLLISAGLFASPYEEKDLPSEVGKPPVGVQMEEPVITFEGYLNSKDVSIFGGVMSCVFYFCKMAEEGFCSDEEGVLLVTGAETGKIPEMLKILDAASGNEKKLLIKLSDINYFAGIRKIVEIKMLEDSI